LIPIELLPDPKMTQIAVTRKLGPEIARCELTHREREPIDFELASSQHRLYEECLAGLGCDIHSLPYVPGLPDCVFVEDTAVVLEDIATVTRPGAASRREEITAVASLLERHRRLAFIEEPGTLDGGDVLVTGMTIFAGMSTRTNKHGIDQLSSISAPYGYNVIPVDIGGCLHLKSGVTQIGDGTFLINRRWIEAEVFSSFKLIDVDPSEPGAANALLVGNTVVYPLEFERTAELIAGAGIDIVTVDVSELAKAEGGVTCCSIIFEGKRTPPSSPAD